MVILSPSVMPGTYFETWSSRLSLPSSREQEQRHRGELLRVGRDLVGQVGTRGRALVRLAVGLVEHELAIADDGDFGRRHAGFGERLCDQLVDWRDLGGRERLGGGGESEERKSAAEMRSMARTLAGKLQQ